MSEIQPVFTPEDRPLKGPAFAERAERLGDQWRLARADMAEATLWVGVCLKRRLSTALYVRKWQNALILAMAAEAAMDELGVEFFDPKRWTLRELMGARST